MEVFGSSFGRDSGNDCQPSYLKKTDSNNHTEVLWSWSPLVACELVLDPNTAYRKLRVSEDKRTVTTVRDYLQYPDNPDRFECFCQLLCATGLTGRCYWEVEWKGVIHVAVTYEGIKRKGNSSACRFGMNDQSWSLCCSYGGFSIWHNSRVMDFPQPSSFPHSLLSNRVAVYVDCPAGILSFYRVSSDSLIHLHTFRTTFTGPLFAGFAIGVGFGIPSSGSVSLCKLEEYKERREGHRNSLMWVNGLVFTLFDLCENFQIKWELMIMDDPRSEAKITLWPLLSCCHCSVCVSLFYNAYWISQVEWNQHSWQKLYNWRHKNEAVMLLLWVTHSVDEILGQLVIRVSSP